MEKPRNPQVVRTWKVERLSQRTNTGQPAQMRPPARRNLRGIKFK